MHDLYCNNICSPIDTKLPIVKPSVSEKVITTLTRSLQQAKQTPSEPEIDTLVKQEFQITPRV